MFIEDILVGGAALTFLVVWMLGFWELLGVGPNIRRYFSGTTGAPKNIDVDRHEPKSPPKRYRATTTTTTESSSSSSSGDTTSHEDDTTSTVAYSTAKYTYRTSDGEFVNTYTTADDSGVIVFEYTEGKKCSVAGESYSDTPDSDTGECSGIDGLVCARFEVVTHSGESFKSYCPIAGQYVTFQSKKYEYSDDDEPRYVLNKDDTTVTPSRSSSSSSSSSDTESSSDADTSSGSSSSSKTEEPLLSDSIRVGGPHAPSDYAVAGAEISSEPTKTDDTTTETTTSTTVVIGGDHLLQSDSDFLISDLLVSKADSEGNFVPSENKDAPVSESVVAEETA